MNDKKIKFLVLFTVFIDVLGLGIVIPVLPFYVGNFQGATSITITAIFAVFALCAFVSSPLLGALSDQYGRRPALLVSIASTALGWFIFAGAPSVLFLYIGRVVDGLAAGNLSVAQSALVDIAKDDTERTANLGLIGAIFGIGFIIGPFIGGALGYISHALPFWFVGFLAMTNFILAYFFFPETFPLEHRPHKQKFSWNPFVPIVRALKDNILRPNYIAFFLFGLAIAGAQSVFSLYLGSVYGYQEFATGIIFMMMGVVIALNQMFFMRAFWLKKFPEPALELIMLVVFALGYIALSIPHFIFLGIGLLGITFGQSVLRVVMNGQLVAKASPDRRGEVLGISASIIALSMGIAPFGAGALFSWHVWFPFLLSAIFLFLAFGVLYSVRQRLKDPISPQNPIISEV